MAITVYGTYRTKIEAMTPADLLPPEIAGGNVQYVYDEYTAAALAAANVIAVCKKLPVGARIVNWWIDATALSTVSLKFGTLADDDEFMENTATANAAKKMCMDDDGITQSLGFEIAEGNGQTLIITTSGPSAATGTIKVAVAYAVKG